MGEPTWRKYPHLATPDVRSAAALPVLLCARRLVVRGWCQRAESCVDADGVERFSLHGALSQTGEIEDEWARRVVRDFLPFPFIPRWNDDPRRRVDEVVRVLDRAIESCGGRRPVARGGWSISTSPTKESAWKR